MTRWRKSERSDGGPDSTSRTVLSGNPESLASDAMTVLRAGWRVSPHQMIGQAAGLALRGFVGGLSLALLVPIVNSFAGHNTVRVPLPIVGTVDFGSTPAWLLVVAFVLLVCAQALIARRAAISVASFQPELVEQVRREAFTVILGARWSFFATRRRSDIVEGINFGALQFGIVFSQLLQASITAVLALATIVISLVVAPGVTSLALVGIVATGLVQWRALAPSTRLGHRAGNQAKAAQAVIHDSMNSMRLIRAHDSAGVWGDRLAASSGTSRQLQKETARQLANAEAASSIAVAAAAACLVLVSMAASLPASSTVVVLLLMGRLAGQARSIGRSLAHLAMSLPSVQMLTDLVLLAREAAEVPVGATSLRSAKDLAASDPLVELANVSYTYPASDGGVKDISFAIERGKATVLAGHSGAGKSTIADLVLGLLRPDSGEVLVGGEPLEPADLAWWRAHIAYVPQETILIPASLRENLVWSVKGNVTDAECWSALDRASASFARSLPDGLDTLLGDQGLRLSGGERQRIAVARALLRKPALLVLDEATSNLDDANEGAVLDTIVNLSPSVTLLVIAHRGRMIRCGDVVVRLAGGRVESITSRSHDHQDVISKVDDVDYVV